MRCWELLRKPIEKFYIWLNRKKRDTLHKGLSTFTLLTAVRNILYLDNSAKGNHYCRSMTKLIGFILQKSTFRSTTIEKENIVTFPKRTRRNITLRVPYRSCIFILLFGAVSFWQRHLLTFVKFTMMTDFSHVTPCSQVWYVPTFRRTSCLCLQVLLPKNEDCPSSHFTIP